MMAAVPTRKLRKSAGGFSFPSEAFVSYHTLLGEANIRIDTVNPEFMFYTDSDYAVSVDDEP